MTSDRTLGLRLTNMIVISVANSGLGVEAGFALSDRITEMQGVAVQSTQDIRKLLDETPAGSPVTFTVIRAGKQTQLCPVSVDTSLSSSETSFAVEASSYASERLGLRHGDADIVLTTSGSVPGRATAKVLGLVFGVGNAAFTIEGTSGKANTALGKASVELVREARMLGADAVVSVTFSMDGSGTSLNRSQTITLLGTAVSLKPIPPATSHDRGEE